MSQQRPSDVDFCIVDSNAELIAESLVRRLQEKAGEMESEANRLFRGRHTYDLNAFASRDLERAIERLTYIADVLRDVSRAQRRVPYLQAAE
jgi:hypothetical protein